MDHDERDPRDWPEPERPDDAAADPTDEASQPPPPDDSPPPEPEATTNEPAPPEAESDAPTEPAAEGPSAAEIESWPSQDAAAPAEPEAPPAAETRPWPTEPPAAGEADEGTWPTSAPERMDEPDAGVPPDSDWPADEAAAATAGAAATTPPAGVEAETPMTDTEAEPPPEEVEAYPAAAAAPVAAAGAAAQGVPDAEAAVGESTLCPRCGTENRPGLAFCRNCGQRLVAAGVATTVERPGTPEGTMACPRCGTHNRSGVAFCQNCGANLRGTAPGYVPPAVAGAAAAERTTAVRGGAVLGPVVLIIGLAGLITGYLLPFAYGQNDSLYERAFGSNGYGIAFWTAYPSDASLADTIYFGLAAPVPILAGLLAILAIAGFVRAQPGRLQVPGLVIALAWAVGLIVMFLIVEVVGSWSGDIVGLLRQLTPGGIILFLASLIVVIGTLTRFGRS